MEEMKICKQFALVLLLFKIANLILNLKCFLMTFGQIPTVQFLIKSNLELTQLSRHLLCNHINCIAKKVLTCWLIGEQTQFLGLLQWIKMPKLQLWLSQCRPNQWWLITILLSFNGHFLFSLFLCIFQYFTELCIELFLKKWQRLRNRWEWWGWEISLTGRHGTLTIQLLIYWLLQFPGEFFK